MSDTAKAFYLCLLDIIFPFIHDFIEGALDEPSWFCIISSSELLTSHYFYPTDVSLIKKTLSHSKLP